MPLCMIQFVLDVNVVLPTDKAFLVNRKQQFALIRALSLEGEKIFSFKRNDFTWLMNPTDFSEVRINTSNNRAVTYDPRTFLFNDQSLLCAGYIDPVKYTVFEVVLQIAEIKDLDSDVFLHTVIGDAGGFLKYFILAYRAVSQENSVGTVSIDDSPVIGVFVSEKGDILAGELNVSFKQYRPRFQWNDPFKKGYTKKMMSRDKLDSLGQLLRFGQKIKLYERLLLDSKEQSYRGNHNLSIVLAETAFEVYLQEKLIQYCEKNNITHLPVSRGGKTKESHEAILNGNVREALIGKYLQEFTKKNILGDVYYFRWYELAYSVRNEIVHNGLTEIEHEAAEKAFTAIIEFINEIEDLLSPRT